MARLVVKSSFVSPSAPGGAAHLENYVSYIATREGVELNNDPSLPDPFREISTRTDQPPTEKQERLIRQLLQDFPDCKNSLEYEDYLSSPSMASASEFIGRCMEDNFFDIHSREGYIQYLATRPGAERDGEHGLWGASDEPLDLDAVGHEVAHHDGNVWTHIISLRREDAVKTGLDSADSWRELVRSQAGTIAHAMGIPLTELKWYAAFHNESHHPHIHMVAYSVGAEPYLGKKGLQEIKSGLANEIFREELLETYQLQTQHRDDLTSQWRGMLAAGDGLEQVDTRLAELAQYLSQHKGKAVYGYLPKQQRELVNRIVDGLGAHPRIQSLYEDWYAQRDKITGIYKGKPDERLPLSKNKAFKPLKNAVIQTAAEMVTGAVWTDNATGALTPADPDSTTWIIPEAPEPPEPLPVTPEEWLERYPYPGQSDTPDDAAWPEPPEALDIPEQLQTTPEEWLERYPYPGQNNMPDGTAPPEAPTALEGQKSAFRQSPEWQSDADAPVPVEEKKKGWWTEAYKNARLLLYGSPDQDPDPEAAFTAMRTEAAAGNPLAQHDLGKMLLQGIGTEADPEAAAAQFQKALAGFKQEANGGKPAYWQYRVGKMYAMGYGVEPDFTQAAAWYKKSVDLDNPFAAYALAGQYYRGQGVELNYEAAFRLYEMAATDEKNSSPYAKWELAKMCEQGIGTTADPEAATAWYAGAYEGFCALEKRQLDDKLVYRLGYMEYNGIGTEQDIPAAIKHFERAAKLKNPSAAYMLAKILVKGELTEKNAPRAAELLEGLKEDEFYAPLAAYHLGRLYLEEPELLDVEKGIANLETASGLKNPSAAYMLAKILAKGELTEKSAPRAAELLEGLKEDEFYAPLAAYHLGRLQASDPAVWDVAKGIENLKFASEHGNHFAAYALGRIYIFGQGEYHDRELGLKYLRAAADQGNEYAAQTLEQIQKQEGKMQASAALGLLRLFERSLKTRHERQQKPVSDLRQRRKELEKKQAQGMKIG